VLGPVGERGREIDRPGDGHGHVGLADLLHDLFFVVHIGRALQHVHHPLEDHIVKDRLLPLHVLTLLEVVAHLLGGLSG